MPDNEVTTTTPKAEVEPEATVDAAKEEAAPKPSPAKAQKVEKGEPLVLEQEMGAAYAEGFTQWVRIVRAEGIKLWGAIYGGTDVSVCMVLTPSMAKAAGKAVKTCDSMDATANIAAGGTSYAQPRRVA